MTSLRYEPVTNTLQMCDDDNIYNPTEMSDTRNIMGDGESAPISIREFLYGHTLRPSQRVFCLSATLAIAFMALICLSTIFIGFGRVLKDIRDDKEKSQQGLQMVPNIVVLSETKTLYLNDKMRPQYVDHINDYLKRYVDLQNSRSKFTKDCAIDEQPADRWCRFDVRKPFQRQGSGCTADDAYGYNTSSPCILLSFKDYSGWRPKTEVNITQLPFACDLNKTRPLGSSMIQKVNISYYPVLKEDANYGAFPMNKIPSRILKDSSGREISDDDGETLYDMPGLAFVKLNLPPIGEARVTVTCYISTNVAIGRINNLDDFNGRTEITFNVLRLK